MTKNLLFFFGRLLLASKSRSSSALKSTGTSRSLTYHFAREMNAAQWSRVLSSDSSDKMMVAAPGERNKQPILDVLLKYLPPKDNPGLVLEVASGPGQHVCYYALHCPHLKWQPTDLDDKCLTSINAHIEHNSLKNVLPPINVDITKPFAQWATPEITAGSCDLVLNINMVHISPWEATVGLFKAAGDVLKPGGFLFMYGPFKIDGVLEPQSNVNFDQYLRSQDSRWGIRDTADMDKLAKQNKLRRENMVDMPANNKCAIYRKET